MPRLLLVASCLCGFVRPLYAQLDASNQSFPQISVTGHGETRVSPDRATIQISVQSRALTAASAAAENARKQSAVISALKRLGLADDQISSTNYNVSPEQKYEPNRSPTIIGYIVTNTVVVEVRMVSMVGPVIDAALSHGANLISGLSFFASNSEAARRTAIAAAVATARADAEVAARAAGGSLGGLLEVNIGSFSPPGPRPMMMRGAMSADAVQIETPINPGQEAIVVEVNTRWKFVPAR